MKNYNFQEKEELLRQICETRDENIEERWLMAKYALASYFKSLFTYGFRSEITKDNINVLKEVRKEMKQEDAILTYLARNIDELDSEALLNFLDKLDILNAKMVFYYIGVLEDIEDSCEMKEPMRAKRSPKKFQSLVDSTECFKEAIALTESEKQVRSILGYSENFWNYIDSIIKRVNVTTNILREVSYAVPMYNGEDEISGISLMVPKIVDYDSAIIALELYKKAHDIYESFGKHDIKESEKGVKLVKYFDEKYLNDKVAKEFGR